jgi:hypothetical protein
VSKTHLAGDEEEVPALNLAGEQHGVQPLFEGVAHESRQRLRIVRQGPLVGARLVEPRASRSQCIRYGVVALAVVDEQRRHIA